MNRSMFAMSGLRIMPIAMCLLIIRCDCNFLSSEWEVVSHETEISQMRFLDSANIVYIERQYDLLEPSGGFGERISKIENDRSLLISRAVFTGIVDTLIAFSSVKSGASTPILSYCPPLLLISNVTNPDMNITVWYYNLESKTVGSYDNDLRLTLTNSPDMAFDSRGNVCNSLTGKTAYVLPGPMDILYYYDAKKQTALFSSHTSDLSNRYVFHLWFGTYDPISGAMEKQEIDPDIHHIQTMSCQVIDYSRALLFATGEYVDGTSISTTGYSIVFIDSLDAGLTGLHPMAMNIDYSIQVWDVLPEKELVLSSDNHGNGYISNFAGDEINAFTCP